MTLCHSVDSSTGAKLGPPTPPTSSLSNHLTRLDAQSSGTITSSSVKSTISESVSLIAMLHASARVFEPRSSMYLIPRDSEAPLPESPSGPTTTTSRLGYVCDRSPSRVTPSSSAFPMLGTMTQTERLTCCRRHIRLQRSASPSSVVSDSWG